MKPTSSALRAPSPGRRREADEVFLSCADVRRHCFRRGSYGGVADEGGVPGVTTEPASLNAVEWNEKERMNDERHGLQQQEGG